MEKYERILEKVKEMLTEERFYHSLCTSNRAEEYAKIYNINVEEARLAGLAHDIAKCLNDKEQKEYIEKYNVELDNMEKESINLSHSKIAAKYCEKEFGFNKDMCNAISFHTTGKENMTLLEKIIFVSDLTGEDRNFDDTKEIYELAKNNLDDAVIRILENTLKSLIKKEKPIHIQTIKAYNYYIAQKND